MSMFFNIFYSRRNSGIYSVHYAKHATEEKVQETIVLLLFQQEREPSSSSGLLTVYLVHPTSD